MESQVGYLALFCHYLTVDGIDWFWIGSFRKNIQLMLVILKAPYLVLFFLFYITDFPDDAICNIVIHADDTTPYSKRDQASDFS